MFNKQLLNNLSLHLAFFIFYSRFNPQNAFKYDRKSAEKFISSILEYMIFRHFTSHKYFFSAYS